MAGTKNNKNQLWTTIVIVFKTLVILKMIFYNFIIHYKYFQLIVLV